MSAKFRVSAVQTYNSAVTGQAGLMFRDRRFNIAEDKGVIDLSESRQKLDVIDRQIVELMKQRLEISKDVAEYKIVNNKARRRSLRLCVHVLRMTLARDAWMNFSSRLWL